MILFVSRLLKNDGRICLHVGKEPSHEVLALLVLTEEASQEISNAEADKVSKALEQIGNDQGWFREIGFPGNVEKRKVK